MTGTSTCYIGEVTVGKGPVHVLQFHYILPHTKRKTTVEKGKKSPCCIFGQRIERES